MKKRPIKFFVLMALISLNSPDAWAQESPQPEVVNSIEQKRAALIAQQQESKSVVVELELERVEGILNYEVQIQDDKTKKSLDLKQSDPVFSIPLNVGKYKMRSRMKSKTETSPWSSWVSLEAQPDPVRLWEMPYQYFVSKKEPAALIKINWNLANGARSYRVWFEKLSREGEPVKDSKIKKIETLSGSFEAKLPVGKYKIGVQSVSSGGIASSVTYLEAPVSIEHALLPKIKIVQQGENEYKWEKLESSKVKMGLFYKPFFGDEFKLKTEKVVDFELWKIPEDLAPGEYRVQFQYVSEELQNGEVEVINFVRRPRQNHFDQAREKISQKTSD